ncbi:hypothetical protein PVAND_013323 [Polypedilum vanderplanki]|uniref:Uncharacterized protein n=1 Tax=Polypedilum vanderplanki TaxID=319348 RepID=A0A9J6CP53_POLVA|nr:hypothetical protein PVAND_013323 [Polypedilum vanderplanki]
MVRVNRRIVNEREPEGPRTPPPRDQPPAHQWNNYRIPRRNRVGEAREVRDFNPQPEEPHYHNPHDRHRPSSRNRRHSRHHSRSPRRPRRERSLERAHRRDNLRRSPQRERRGQLRIVVAEHQQREHAPPNRPIRDRLGPIVNENNLVRVVRPRITRVTHVLQFPDMPIEMDMVNFLTQLSGQIRGITGASRQYDYGNDVAGKCFFVYAVIQNEVDEAVGREFTFEGNEGTFIRRPILIPSTITSVLIFNVSDPALTLVPTIMLRHLTPVTTRQAIAAVIDVAQIVARTGCTITHIRIPAHNIKLNKTASFAFVGINSVARANELDGYVHERVVKPIPFTKSDQAPVLIPTGRARPEQVRDVAWSEQSCRVNLLIVAPNPFAP